MLHIAKTKDFTLLLLLTKLNTQLLHNTTSPVIPNTHNTTREILVTFIFHEPLTRSLSHLFRNTNFKITLRYTNTNRNTLRTRTDNSVTKHLSGIYEMKRQTCKLYDIGETGSKLELRYRQHIRHNTSNTPHSAYAKHNLDNAH